MKIMPKNVFFLSIEMCFKFWGYVLLLLSFQVRNWIIPTRIPRMAAQDAPQSKSTTVKKSVLKECLPCIAGTGRLETATAA